MKIYLNNHLIQTHLTDNTPHSRHRARLEGLQMRLKKEWSASEDSDRLCCLLLRLPGLSNFSTCSLERIFFTGLIGNVEIHSIVPYILGLDLSECNSILKHNSNASIYNTTSTVYNNNNNNSNNNSSTYSPAVPSNSATNNTKIITVNNTPLAKTTGSKIKTPLISSLLATPVASHAPFLNPTIATSPFTLLSNQDNNKHSDNNNDETNR